MPWWDGPKPAGKVQGNLKQVDCLGKQARLVVEGDDRKTVRLLVADPGKIAIIGAGELSLGCGVQKPRRVVSRIFPQGQRPARHRGRSGHHRVPVTAAHDAARYRWLVLAVFVLSSAINYLDRQTLATLAPVLRAEFHLSNAQYGLILTAFSITYAASAPFAGMLIDRIGLNRAISLAVGLWSCAGIATGFTRGLGGPGGLPRGAGRRRSGRHSGGGQGHPPVSAAGRTRAGQRRQSGRRQPGPDPRARRWPRGSRCATAGARPSSSRAFWGLRGFRCGTGPRAGRARDPAPKLDRGAGAGILRDRRLWAFVAANALSMVGYSLWTNWTTLYLVDVHRLTLVRPPGTPGFRRSSLPLGGFAAAGSPCGWWNAAWRRPPRASASACAAAVLSLATAAIPAAPTAAWASAGISLSIFAVAAFSVNMYTLPLDVFGGARAAFAVSMLVASYGAVQAVISPAFGKVIDLYGYAPVTVVAALTPLAACAVLWSTRSVR